MRTRRRIPSLFPFSAVCLAFALLHCSARQEGKSEDIPRPLVSVKISAIAARTVNLTIKASGRTRAERRENILSPIAGRIIEQNGVVGARVNRGDIVAVVRSKESDAAIDGAQALLQQARTRNQRREAQQSLDLAKSSQNRAELKASLSGVIVARGANLNEIVGENTLLYAIIDPASMDFVADAQVADLPKLRRRQLGEVLIDADSSKRYPVAITSINAVVDSQSRGVEVHLSFTGPPSHTAELRDGMPGIATIITDAHPNALTVPKSAILRNDENSTYTIVTITRDSLAISIPVKVGASTDSGVEIMSGALREGMPVITVGNYGLPDSTRVTTAPLE